MFIKPNQTDIFLPQLININLILALSKVRKARKGNQMSYQTRESSCKNIMKKK